ncbi:hypothetical protein [Ornithinibacillus hominis]|uniref:Uncharacterized protein n=1 Tax=Ornithinibacillus hominis TaxID=2763055 RepID=A0A923RH31_9BACI|nr:hypothetical protein [Ornithinibacillus hominis]MBC5636350.1 hypothetical protein [Ornithinibacillus hominis]
MTHHNELWILLQNLLHNQLQQIGTESSIQEQLDHIILTMLVDYKVKGNITNQIPPTNNANDADLSAIIHELDNAIEVNRKEFDNLLLLLKK